MQQYSKLNSWIKLVYLSILVIFINNLVNIHDQNQPLKNGCNKVESLIEVVLLYINDTNELQDLPESDENKLITSTTSYIASYPVNYNLELPLARNLKFVEYTKHHTFENIPPETPPPKFV
ncbi:hypothetical protein OU798_05865 [Prolixibacteraceae bacterium Z1-6]|uniref:Uncharacterized protein n=1 Tax=Draconibacterium aestuarii TaxID=2998507 RepID=A0A9X3F3G5_9BACT|nr:hypothetical protein [Prolixibacteraceae bacterium Z1-6]